jgi:hypothetical protein
MQIMKFSVFVKKAPVIVAPMSVPDRRLCNVTSVHSGSTDYATLVIPFYLIVSLLYII